MTSFAFILGCVPLWIATGAGAASRRILGTVVIVGMLAATGDRDLPDPGPLRDRRADRQPRARRRAPAAPPRAAPRRRPERTDVKRLVAADPRPDGRWPGCAVGPNYTAPARSRRPTPSTTQADGRRGRLAGRRAVVGRLPRPDAAGPRSTRRSQKGYDPQIAAWRVEEARARAGIARSEFFPQIGYQGQFERSQASEFVCPRRPPGQPPHASTSTPRGRSTSGAASGG